MDARDYALGIPSASATRQIRSATTSGCSTKQEVEIDNPGNDQHPVGWTQLGQHLVLVLMGGVCAFQSQRADAGLVNGRQDGLGRDVVHMRAVVVTPAYVQADAIGRDVGDRDD